MERVPSSERVPASSFHIWGTMNGNYSVLFFCKIDRSGTGTLHPFLSPVPFMSFAHCVAKILFLLPYITFRSKLIYFTISNQYIISAIYIIWLNNGN